jgi:hypothetical protein
MAVARRGVPRRVTWLLVVALTGTVLTGLSLVLGGPAAAEPTSGRYYVVGKPVNGQREYLYDIARRTLGNGNRYSEIVELNKGRHQPDGGTLVDAMEVRPGWILELPADAKGDGVLATRPAGLAERAPRERRTARPGPRAGDDGVNLTRIGVFGLAVLIIVAGLALLRAGSSPRGPATASAVGPPGQPYGPDVPPAPPNLVPLPSTEASLADPEPPVRRRTIERIDRSMLDAGRPVADPASAAVTEPIASAPAEPEDVPPTPETSRNGITTLGQPWKRGWNTPPVASSARAGDAAGGAARTAGTDAGEPSATGEQAGRTKEAEPTRPVL